MKKSPGTLICVLLLLSPLATAGVVMNVVTRDAAGQETGRTGILAQGDKIRMNEIGSQVSMIFLGDEFLILDHGKRRYMVMDEAMLEQVNTQINAAMQQMEAQLAKIPPEQRAMMEEMMKGQMQGLMETGGDQSPKPRVEANGVGEWQSRPCDKYTVYEKDVKTQDICATNLQQIEGGEEMMQAFFGMAAFVTKLTESMPIASGDSFNPGELMDQIGGFPVRTLEYSNGVVTAETLLESIAEEDIDESIFAAPSDYQRQDQFEGR